VARELVTIAYLMLKNNEPYRYAKPKLMCKKFGKLRGDGGSADGLRPTRSGKNARPALDDVYLRADLPAATAPENLPAGERRMLADRGLEGFVWALYSPPSSGAETSESCASRQSSAPTARRPRAASRPVGRPT
jgi:hypothetical protein